MATITNSICASNVQVVVQSGSGALNIGTAAVASTITMGNITGATTVNINTGTGGSTHTTTNGTYSLVTGTGAINIGADAAAKTITIGNVTGATAVTINSGTGAINIGTSIAKTITIGNGTGATAINITTGSGILTVTSTNGAMSFVPNGGTLNLNNTTNGIINMGAIASSSGINIFNGGAIAILGVPVNINTTAVNRTTNIGNNTGASPIIMIAGTSGCTLTTTNAVVTVATGTGAVTISGDATANAVNIATGAGAKTLIIGSTNTTSAVTINTGSGGVSIPSFTTTGALVSNASGLITDATASTSGFVLTSNGSGSVPTFQTPAGMIWNDVTGTSASMSVNNGYSSNNVSLVTLTLPSTAVFGSRISVSGYNTGLWKIAQNSSQVIHFGAVDTTTGVGGSLAATSRYDQISLICSVANTDWVVTNSVGNITYV